MLRRLPRAGLLLPALLAAASVALAEADPAYTALRAARPAGATVAVENLTLERDVFRYKFDKGVFQFLAPVDGKITGAVFVGTGSWQLNPADEGERRHLALVAGEKGLEVLSDSFGELVLLFTDATEAEIRRGSTEGAGAPPRAAAAWDAFRATQRDDVEVNLQIRILADVLRNAEPGAGVFLAASDGKKLPASLALVDPTGLEWFAPHSMPGSENSGLWVIPEFDAGFWYLARCKADAGAPPLDPVADAEAYTIDSTILDETRLEGTTTIRLRVNTAGLRVLPLELYEKLRIREAHVAPADGDAWQPAAFIQEKDEEDSNPAVVLPTPAEAGATLRVRLRYAGKDVLHDTGDGSFAVGARQSWYPNLGSFRDTATFDLTYRVPKGKQVVSVGERVSDRAEGNTQVSVWKAARPIRVAGFNYGKFRRLDENDKDSGMKIEVFTNPGTPDIVHEINAALSSGSFGGGPGNVASENRWGTQAGLQSLQLDTETFAQGAMADGLNSARTFTAYFGPLAEKHVAITQQAQWFFGQSWPSLIFLPYLAVLDGTQRRELGLGGNASTDFVDLVGPHEVAHQWWGHSVGWASYRDLWLSEGFSEFAASLVMQRTLGPKRFSDFWETSRRWILEKPRGSTVSNDQAGPISLGARLQTRQTPAAYQALVYSKGAYVLQMLRMLMWDPKGQPQDAKFIGMMRDFAATWADKEASTRDFQTVVERHMTPMMDRAGDGKMDWFFRQWVQGTEIPRYVTKVAVSDAGGGQYKLSGSVSQEGVSKDFLGFLPLYLEFDKGKVARLAVVSLAGNQSVPIDTTLKLPERPKRVIANAMHDVLTRD
jgi:hypothetical protein